MKKLFLLAFLFLLLSSVAFSQRDASKNALGRLITDEVTKTTNGYIEVYKDVEG
jgi:capsid portal protein